MIKSKLHNPIIAKNSHIENAVVEKVNLVQEQIFSDIGNNVTPIVPEIGRIWFNTESGTFKFANIGNGGDGKNYVDEFLSRTDLRAQHVASKVTFGDTVKVDNLSGNAILTVDSNTTDITIDGKDHTETLSGNEFLDIAIDDTITVGQDYSLTVGRDYTLKVGRNKLEIINGTETKTINGDVLETINGNKTTTITGNSIETIIGDQTTNYEGNLNLKVAKALTLTDSNNNIKLKADNIANGLTLNYGVIDINAVTETHTISNKFIVNDGLTDKLVLDNTNNKVSLVYATLESTNSNVKFNVSNKLVLTDGNTDKIVADNSTDELNVHYSQVNVVGNTSFEGNVLITGDLTVGGQTTKVDIAAETMKIADNVIVLNSNLTDQVDPRLASAIVDGIDVDNDAGIAVNRGSQGVLDLIKWVESTDTSTLETLKQGTAQVSIWNYEAATPSYELHQIMDAYTLGRQAKDTSGSSLVGYDGEQGVHYVAAIAAGATPAEALDYSFKIDPNKLDNVIDEIVQEIDTIKYNDANTSRVGETPSAGTEFTITHNLGTVFVDVRIQREEAGKWYFDVLPVQVIDENTIKIGASETTRIRYMISAIQGFDVNQATELVIA